VSSRNDILDNSHTGPDSTATDQDDHHSRAIAKTNGQRDLSPSRRAHQAPLADRFASERIRRRSRTVDVLGDGLGRFPAG
jgi:hypothetical protein